MRGMLCREKVKVSVKLTHGIKPEMSCLKSYSFKGLQDGYLVCRAEKTELW